MDRFVNVVRLAKNVLSKKRTATAIASVDDFAAVTEEFCSDLEALSETSEPTPKELEPVRINLELITQALAVECQAPLRQRPCATHFFSSLPHACAVQRLCDLGSREDASAWGARSLALQSVAALLRACGPSVAVLPHLHVHLPLSHLLRATAKHVDARLYANAADNEPFTEVDDAEQAALASLVLELWQRPDRDDYFLVEDPALRFPPQFDLVSSVAPLLFRESNGANIGQLARASMLHAAQLRDIRVALFVVHHSGVCGLLAGALTSAFEVLPRDLAPFHVDSAIKENTKSDEVSNSGRVPGRRLSNSSGTVAGLQVAFAGFMERWAFCDAMLQASWSIRDATSWVSSLDTQQRPRARSRAGSFGRRCSTLETLVNAYQLGRGYERASIFVALLEAITKGFVLASLRRQLLGAGLKAINQHHEVATTGGESHELSDDQSTAAASSAAAAYSSSTNSVSTNVSSSSTFPSHSIGTRRRSYSSSAESLEAAAEKAAIAAQTFLAWSLSAGNGTKNTDDNSSEMDIVRDRNRERSGRGDINGSSSGGGENWRSVENHSGGSPISPSRLLATATAHALVSGDGGADFCAVLIQRLTRGRGVDNASKRVSDHTRKKTEGTVHQQEEKDLVTASASLSAGELLLQLLQLCAGGPELLDLCLGHKWEQRVAAQNADKGRIDTGSGDKADIDGGSNGDFDGNNSSNSNGTDDNNCVDHNRDSILNASSTSNRYNSVRAEDAPGWFAAAFPGSAVARWTCLELGPDSPVKPNSGAAVGAPDGAFGESVEKYLEVAEEEQVRRMLSEQQECDRKMVRRRRRCSHCTSSACNSEDNNSSPSSTRNSSSSDPVAISTGLVKGVTVRVREVLLLEQEGSRKPSSSPPVPLEEALAVTGLVAELAQAAAAAAAVAVIASANGNQSSGSSSSETSGADVHRGSSCCCNGNIEAEGARALHAAVFGDFSTTSVAAPTVASLVPCHKESSNEDANRHCDDDNNENVFAALAACWHQASGAVHEIFDSRRKLADLRVQLGILKQKRSAESSHKTTAALEDVPGSSHDDTDGESLLPEGPEGRALILYVILDECVKEIFGILSAGVLLQSQFKPSTVLNEGSAPSSSAASSFTDTATTASIPGGGASTSVAASGDAGELGDDGDDDEAMGGGGVTNLNEFDDIFANFMPEDPSFFEAFSSGDAVLGDAMAGNQEIVQDGGTSATKIEFKPVEEGQDMFGFGNL